MTTVPQEAHETLWAVNIHGPDDLIAAPDYMSAVRMANAFNAWWLNLKMKKPHNDAIDARMWAVPTDWPGDDAQGHTEELSKPHPEYQWLREASALPHLPQGVGVKELEWRQEDNGDFIAESIVGWYHIGLPHRMWNLTKPIGEVFSFWTLDEARASAQADYDARILSALEPSAARKELMKQIREGTAHGFLNDGSQPEGNPDLDCPYCCGSGHRGDVHPSAARELALEEGFRKGTEAAAKLIECGCKDLLHGKGECQFPGNCSLEDAAAIRALNSNGGEDE